MSQINFAFTLDNSNVIASVDQTIKKFEDMASTLKGIGAGTNFNTLEEALEGLNKSVAENEKYISDTIEKIAELAEQQREAALAGDTAKVAKLGAEMKGLAEDVQAVVSETRDFQTVLDQLTEKRENPFIDHTLASVQEFDKVTEKMTELSNIVEELNSRGIDFTNTEQAVATLRESLKQATEQIIQHRQQIDELYAKQKEAVLSGDAEAVAQYGEKIGETATEMEKLTADTQRLSDVLSMVRGTIDTGTFTGFAADMAQAQEQIRQAGLTLEVLAQTNNSVDLSSSVGQVHALTEAIQDNKRQIEEYKKTIAELKKEQQEAFNAGDFTKSEELSNQILQLANAVQQLTQENENYAQVLRTVTNAEDELKNKSDDRLGIMAKMLGGQEQYNEIMRLLPPELKRVVGGINSITKASLKFIATPLGAVLTALVLAFKAIYTWLGKTSEGQKELARISGYLSGILAGLTNVVKKVGEALYKAFSNPIETVKNLGNSINQYVGHRLVSVMKSAGKFVEAFQHLNKGEWKEAGDAFKESWQTLLDGSLTKKVGEVVGGVNNIGKAEAELNVKRDQLRRDRMAWEKEEGELDKQIAEQRNKLYVGSMSEREKASAKMMDLINKKYDKQVEFAQREYEIKRDSNALTDSSLDDLEEEAHLQKQVLEIEAQRESAKRMAVRVDNMAARSGLQAAEKSREMEEKREELMESLAEATAEAEREAAAVKISAMKEGFGKEKAELEHEHQERQAQLWKEYRDRLDQIEKIQKAEYKAAHGGSTAGFKFNGGDEAAVAAFNLWRTKSANENAQYEQNNAQHLENLVKQYQTYEEKEKEIRRQAKEDIEALEKEGYAEQAKLREKAMEQELTELRRHEKDIYKRLAQDTSKWGIVSIQKAIVDAQAELDELSSTPEKAVANADAIENLRRTIERLKETAKDFSFSGALKMLLKPDEGATEGQSFADRWQAMKDAWMNMSEEDKWKNIGGWVARISNGLKQAAEYMREVADITGDSKLADSADMLEAVSQNFAAAGQGAAQGGWIGAIVGGVTDILSQTVEAFENVGLQEAIATKNAQDWAYALETAFLNIDESKFETVFGAKTIGLAQENYKKATEAMTLYYQKLTSLNNQYGNQQIEQYEKLSKGLTVFGAFLTGPESIFLNPTTWLGQSMMKESNQWKAYQEAITKGQTGLQRMLVTTKKQTGWAKFWGAKDEFTSLGDLAPEMWDENGELIVENAKKFLSVNTQITDEQRKQIEQLIELKEGYDEAMKAVDDAISENFGTLAEDLTDIIWDSVMNGTDAWEQFEKVGAEAITKLGKQMIQEMLISEYLEQYREKMREAYKNTNAADTQRELRNITAEIFSGMEQMLAAGTMVAEEYQHWAQENGFDLSTLNTQTQTQEAKAGGFQTMSQDTADELNGRFTALQLSNEMISQTAREGLVQIIAIGELLNAEGGTLSEIRNLHVLEVGYLEDIAKFTKPLLGFGDILTRIQDNTAKL